MNKKTVLITGGAKRVGKEIALSLANKNTNIIIHYNKSLNEAKKLKLLIEDKGSKCALIKSNLSNQIMRLSNHCVSNMASIKLPYW